jgi:hypothetical protein
MTLKASAIMKRRQPFTPLHERAGGTENGDQGTDESWRGQVSEGVAQEFSAAVLHLQPWMPACAGMTPSGVANAVGGRRKSLKRLELTKESEACNLDFLPPDLEFVPPGLDFLPKNLDVLRPAGGAGLCTPREPGERSD